MSPPATSEIGGTVLVSIDADVLLVWAVSSAVVLSVAWLALHGWRQGRTLRRWAADRSLPCGRDVAGDGVRLDPFARDDDHLVRELGRVREVVALEPDGWIFRCEERLDFTPWSSGTGPPRTRVAATCPVSGVADTYSVFDEGGRPCADRAPGLRFSSRAAAGALAARLPDPPHPVSVTTSGGRALVYLLTPSGGVSEDDLDYLARVVRRLRADGSTTRRADRTAIGPEDGRSAERLRAASGAR